MIASEREIPSGRGAWARVRTQELTGHRKRVYCVAWSGAGARLASGSQDGTARVWAVDVERGIDRPLHALKGHDQSVGNMGWDPASEERLATCSGDRSVRFWDLRAGKCVARVDTGAGNLNLAWHPDGRTLAVGDMDDVVSLVDTRTLRIARAQSMPYTLFELDWSRDGARFFTSSGQGNVGVHVWPDISAPVRSLHAHTASCFCLATDPGGHWLASGGADALVSLWDLGSLTCVRTLAALDSPVRTLGFSHDSSYLAYATDDALIDVVDLDSGELVRQVQCPTQQVAWSPKARALAYVGGEGESVSIVRPAY